MTHSIKPENVRSIAVLVDCTVCEGDGKTYLSNSSRLPSPCPVCTGTGEVIVGMSLADFRTLLKEAS